MKAAFFVLGVLALLVLAGCAQEVDEPDEEWEEEPVEPEPEPEIDDVLDEIDGSLLPEEDSIEIGEMI